MEYSITCVKINNLLEAKAYIVVNLWYSNEWNSILTKTINTTPTLPPTAAKIKKKKMKLN